jgi:hypothetical protein
MTTRDIFQRELAGEVIALTDPEYPKILALTPRSNASSPR